LLGAVDEFISDAMFCREFGIEKSSALGNRGRKTTRPRKNLGAEPMANGILSERRERNTHVEAAKVGRLTLLFLSLSVT
jgi:hypothetical protein